MSRSWTYLRTPLCDLVGVEYPIFSVGMGRGAGGGGPGGGGVECQRVGCSWCLAAHVGRADCGDRAHARGDVEAVRCQRDPRHRAEGMVERCIEECVPVLVLFWGDPGPWAESAHRHGVKVVVQLGSLEDALSEEGAVLMQATRRGTRDVVSVST
jgi:nitronate monooxygenase